MSAFTDAELDYLLHGGAGLGRLATVDETGQPRIVPLGWRYNEELDTIDIGGRDLPATRKFRDVRRNPLVAFVVDDVLPPWRPRSVIVHGRAEALDQAHGPDGTRAPVIRITPARVISWGLDSSPT